MNDREWFSEAQHRIAVSESVQAERSLKEFTAIFSQVIEQAKLSFDDTIFMRLAPARQFVICDVIWAIGPGAEGWAGIKGLSELIARAQRQKESGNSIFAHQLFLESSTMLLKSAWGQRVDTERARRDSAMMAAGIWCSPNGDGSDILRP